MTSAPPPALDLDQAIAQALSRPHERVQRLELADGQVVWFKQAEELQGLMRLQKGNGQQSLERERAALKLLNAQHLPVAPLLAEGPNWFVTPDIGATLRDDMRAPQPHSAQAFSAAGRALAQLHLAGFSHGRPAIRDICWDGSHARFIDFERFQPKQRSPWTLALDVVIFAHSLYAEAIPSSAAEAQKQTLIEQALTSYAQAAPEIWRYSQRLARGLSWLAPLARLGRNREFQAVAPCLARLR